MDIPKTPLPAQRDAPTPAAADEPTDLDGSLTLQIRLPQARRWAVALVLALAVLLNLVWLYPEVAIEAPHLNDAVLHQLGIQRAAEAILLGQNPTDPWLGVIDLGYPLFHHYQHLSYQPPALAVALSGGAISPEAALRWATYLLLCLWPLPLYWSARRFGLHRLAALLAAILGPLIATHGLYGLDASSFVWSGLGLYTQLWAAWLFPMALAQGYTTLRTGKSYFLTVLLAAALLLSHLVYAYMLFASLALLTLLAIGRPKGCQDADRLETWSRRILRLLVILALVALVASYFALPYLLDRTHMNRSVWELPWKYDSFGAGFVLSQLVSGELFDAGRFPSLTLLVVLGTGYCLWHWRDEQHRALVLLGLFWLLLYFGRPTWGVLLNLLPLGHELHLHRLIGGFHLVGIYLMGLGLAWPWRWALARRNRLFLLLPTALTLLLLLPVYRERHAYYRQNGAWKQEAAQALAAEQPELDALVETIRSLPPGRVYAGLPARWGGQLKIGPVPLYAYLNAQGLDMLGYLYHALSLNADIQVLFDDGRLEQYQLFNVRYVVTPQGWSVPDYYQTLGDFGRWRLYQIPSGGYFDLVDSDLAFVGRREEFFPAASAWLASDLLPAKQHPTISLGDPPLGYPALYPLAEAPAEIPLLPVAPDGYRGEVLTETQGSNWYAATVDVARDCWLMLKATYHPGWRAYLDGQPVETAMLMPSYVGVRLPPGQHTVRLVYSGGPWRLALMALGALTLVLLALAERRPHLLRALRLRLFGEPTEAPSQVAAAAAGPLDQPPPAEPSLAQRPRLSRRVAVGLYLCLLSVYLITNAGHFFSTDHVAVYLVTQSLLERGELALPGPMNDAVPGPDGKYYSMFGVGQSLVAAPFYVVGRTVEQLASPELQRLFAGVDLGQWGGTVPIYFVSLLNQFLSPLICLLVLSFCLHLGFSWRASLATTLAFALGTATWVYARDSFQHPLESLMLLSSTYILYTRRAHLRPATLLLAGAALGLGVLTRTNVLLVVPLLVAYLFYLIATQAPQDPGTAKVSGQEAWGAGLTQSARALWRRGVAQGAVPAVLLFALPIVLALALVLQINHMRHGSYLAFHPLAQAAGFSTPAWVGLYGNLLSPGRSLFLYSPPLILGLVAAPRFLRKHRPEALLFGAIGLVYILLYSLYSYWDGGWCWGPRVLVPVLPFLAIPIAGDLHTNGRATALAILAFLGVLVQVPGVTVNYSYIYHDWLAMGLNPPKAFLFVPQISPIPTHWQALLSGRHIDLWLHEVWRGFGPTPFALALLVYLLPLIVGLSLTGAPAALARWLQPRLATLRRPVHPAQE